jgi:hypothetical protein
MTVAFHPAPPAALGVEKYHHLSHRRLLRPVVGDPGRTALNAIIVPTIRPAALLAGVVEVARAARTQLLVLCSGLARASDVVALHGRANITAVDITGVRGLMPDFETTDVHQRTQRYQSGDLSLKRNLGLLIARTAGWERILFLDDDIDVPDPSELEAVAAAADRFDAVGLHNTGFEDNSVVCHALRHIGGRQDTFVGGGAMVVRPGANSSFFPHIYNEDWLFLLHGTSLGSVAVYGTMKQRAFDPYDTTARAESQEFGDCVAEGIYWLLDRGSPIRHADTRYWRESLRRRRDLIAHIERRMVNAPTEPDVRAKLIASLGAARDAHARITPETCNLYMNAWHRDRAAWRRHLRQHPMAVTPRLADVACKELGILVNCDMRPGLPRLSLRLGSETVNGWDPPISAAPRILTSPVLSAT